MKRYGYEGNRIIQTEDATTIFISDDRNLTHLDEEQRRAFNKGIDVFVGWDERNMRLYIRKDLTLLVYGYFAEAVHYYKDKTILDIDENIEQNEINYFSEESLNEFIHGKLLHVGTDERTCPLFIRKAV